MITEFLFSSDRKDRSDRSEIPETPVYFAGENFKG